MYAAVVRSFDHSPRYETFDTPVPKGEHEVLVEVLAAGLHPRVRAGASGSHYTSTDELPLIPGVDGVGRLPDGKIVYFVLPDTTFGSMAEKAVIARRRSVLLPDDVDPVVVAAGMNPAMSSWLALRKRIHFEAGSRVLILGATGSAGQMAIQIAKLVGASVVIAGGRNAEILATLPDLGADQVVSLAGDPEQAAATVGEAAADVDVVIDYVWGKPAERIMPELLTRREERSEAIDWIHIGSTAGDTIALRSELLRAANLRILGSGQGSIGTRDIVAELPALVAELAKGKLKVNAKAVALAEVEDTWDTPMSGSQRIVFTPTSAITH